MMALATGPLSGGADPLEADSRRGLASRLAKVHRIARTPGGVHADLIERTDSRLPDPLLPFARQPPRRATLQLEHGPIPETGAGERRQLAPDSSHSWNLARPR
jgi:hypothetical protein